MTDKLERFFEGRLPPEWKAKAILISPLSRAARIVTIGPTSGDVVWGRAMRPEEFAVVTEDCTVTNEVTAAVNEVLIDMLARTWSFYAGSRISELRVKLTEETQRANALNKLAREVRTAGGWVADIVDIYMTEIGGGWND